MAKRRSSYGNEWGYFPPSRPIKPVDGIQSKTKKGAFGESWWAKRWIQVLESYGIGTRLQRGRSYARGGQVLDIKIAPGKVTAKVQGSRSTPYQVSIQLPTLSQSEWDKVIDTLSQQAIFAAKLLTGDMPNDIEQAFNAAKVPLFPAKGNQIITDCSCPDYANPCKHIAAVYYLLGEQFDADPFLIFTLRGQTKDQLIEALRSRRTTTTADDSVDTPPHEVIKVLTLEEQIETFWQVGDLNVFPVHIAPPDIPQAVLKRLGTSPAGTSEAFSTIYSAMSNFVLKKVFEQA